MLSPHPSKDILETRCARLAGLSARVATLSGITRSSSKSSSMSADGADEVLALGVPVAGLDDCAIAAVSSSFDTLMVLAFQASSSSSSSTVVTEPGGFNFRLPAKDGLPASLSRRILVLGDNESLRGFEEGGGRSKSSSSSHSSGNGCPVRRPPSLAAPRLVTVPLPELEEAVEGPDAAAAGRGANSESQSSSASSSSTVIGGSAVGGITVSPSGRSKSSSKS